MPSKVRDLAETRPTETGSALIGAIVGLLIGHGIIPEELAGYYAILVGSVATAITTGITWYRNRKA